MIGYLLIANIGVGTYFVGGQGEANAYTSLDGKITVLPGEIRWGSLRLTFPDHQHLVKIHPGEQVATVNYFVGSDRSKWKRGVPVYREILLEDLYPGIDLKVMGTQEGNVKIQWVVEPGADPEKIKLRIEGTDFHILEGNIVAEGLVIERPRAFQGTSEVPISYRNVGSGEFVFDIGDYDPDQELVIDPSVVVGGGTKLLDFADVKVYNGYVYVAFYSKNTVGLDGISGYDTVGDSGSNSTTTDAIILKFTADLTTVVSGTILGGSDKDEVMRLFVTSDGVYVAGRTSSSDFPVTNGSRYSGYYDVFISKLSLDLNNLEGSTYLGGDNWDEARGLFVSSDAVYVTGYTQSYDFPTTPGAYCDTLTGEKTKDAFISKFDLNLSTLSASTYLGGSEDEIANAITLANNKVYVAGWTNSGDFPTPVEAYDTSLNQRRSGTIKDAFVSRMSLDLTTLDVSTFLGGSGADTINTIVEYNNSIYVAGFTTSSSSASTPFPLVNAYDDRYGGDGEGFVSKFDLDLLNLGGSSYFGGSDWEEITDLIVDEANGLIYAVGITSSSDLPLSTAPAYDKSYNGEQDAFVVAFLPDLNTIQYSTYLGGTKGEANVRAVIEGSNFYIGGTTTSSDIAPPSANGAYSFASIRDIFVGKMDLPLTTLDNMTFAGQSVITVDADRFYDLKYYNGYVYAVGETGSHNIASFNNENILDSLSYDAFIVKLTEDLSLSTITFIGGTAGDAGRAIYVDDNGVYIAGYTLSIDFPTTTGVLQEATVDSVNQDIFVSIFDLDLGSLLYSTYVSGSSAEVPEDIVAGGGSVYMTGWTQSSDFPGASNSLSGGKDAFVAKLSSDLSSIVSTYLGGAVDDEAYALYLTGDALYVGGYTSSSDFPVTPGAYDQSLGDVMDAFVTKYSSDNLNLLASTFLGGDTLPDVSTDFDEVVYGIYVSTDAVYVTGATSVANFPTTAGVYDSTYNTSTDAFVTKLTLDLDNLLASTFFGGSGGDYGYDIDYMETSGESRIYIAGYTTSSDLLSSLIRLKKGYDNTYNGGGDAYVAAFYADLSDLINGTYLGGSNTERAEGVELSSSWVFAGGYTESSDFPLTFGSVQLNGVIGTQGVVDGFVTSFDLGLTPVELREGIKDPLPVISIDGSRLIIQIPSQAYVGMDVFDMSGKLVRRYSFGIVDGEVSASLEDYAPGVYILHIRIGDRLSRHKIVIY